MELVHQTETVVIRLDTPLQRHIDQFAMAQGQVESEGGVAHKLSGDTCSNLSSTTFPGGSRVSISTATARQSDNC